MNSPIFLIENKAASCGWEGDYLMAINITVALYLMGESGKLNDSTENLSEVQKGRGVTPHPIRRFSQVLRYRKKYRKKHLKTLLL